MPIQTEDCDPFGEQCIDEGKKGKLNVIAFKESKSRYTANNPNGNYLIQYTVDNCLIESQNEVKCDKLVIDCTTKSAYFVELKGVDLSKASKQIINSIGILRPKLKGFKIFARIVLTKSRSDNTRNESFSKLVKLLKANVLKGNTPFIETYK